MLTGALRRSVLKSGLVKWLITRESAAAQRECTSLKARGVDALAVPCLTFVPRPWPTWDAQAGEAVLVLTSQRAAQAAIESGQPWRFIAATAPATAAFLTSHHLGVDIAAEGGVIGLAQAVAKVWSARGKPQWHFCYPTSDAGLDRDEQLRAVELLATIGPVERAVVYETHPVAGLTGALAPLLGGAWAACFSSPSAVEAFLDARPPQAQAPAHVVCFGRSTATSWNARHPPGWSDALLTHSIVETVVSLEECP
jgi:uroporphyrinogen-III synthase